MIQRIDVVYLTWGAKHCQCTFRDGARLDERFGLWPLKNSKPSEKQLNLPA
jgi:hypothetical protein